jgi:hypothetical protein
MTLPKYAPTASSSSVGIRLDGGLFGGAIFEAKERRGPFSAIISND